MTGQFTERTIPDVAQKRPSSVIQCARETYGLHPDWKFWQSTIKGEGIGEFFEIEGGVYKTYFKHGPREGKIDYGAPESGTSCTVCLPRILYEQWKARWELETGLCSNCNGSGRTLASCGISGTTYRTCGKCGGNGAAQDSRSAASVTPA